MAVLPTTCSIQLSPRETSPDLYQAKLITDETYRISTAKDRFSMLSVAMFALSAELGKVLYHLYSEKDEPEETEEEYISHMAKMCTEGLVELIEQGGKLESMESTEQALKTIARGMHHK